MKRAYRASICFLIFLSACKSTSKPGDQSNYDVLSSARQLVIEDSEIAGINFNFCAEKRSFSLTNALWLVYFAANQYTHFKEWGPALERRGFGGKGEGDSFRQIWYALRIKRISEGLKDVDDTWDDEAERTAHLAAVKDEYLSLYGRKYVDNGVGAIEFERSIISNGNGEHKIAFFSGTRPSQKGGQNPGSTQALYAEHDTLDFSIISFRGTETDAKADVFADVDLIQADFEGYGRAHRGFIKALAEIEEPLITFLKQRSQHKKINLWLTGHSLGGALSTLFTAKLMYLHENGELPNVNLVGTYNLGSPRIGELAFATKFDQRLMEQKVNFVRLRNYKDLVTTIPFGRRMDPGYWHVGALGYFSMDGTLYTGNGWQDIDGNSDILDSTPTSTGDHQSTLYWERIKKAYSGNGLSETCSSGGNTPLRPYEEYSPERLRAAKAHSPTQSSDEP